MAKPIQLPVHGGAVTCNKCPFRDDSFCALYRAEIYRGEDDFWCSELSEEVKETYKAMYCRVDSIAVTFNYELTND